MGHGRDARLGRPPPERRPSRHSAQRWRRRHEHVRLARRDLHSFWPRRLCAPRLWADRMPQSTAEALLAADSEAARAQLLAQANWYNATATPYEQGLREEDPRLFGEKIGVVKAGGVLTADVKSHAARVFRLRRIAKDGDKFKGKSIDRVAKDEL
jgi:hypothetical protein